MPTFMGAHPAAWADTWYKNLGTAPITIADPWATDYVHYNYVKAQVNSRISKRLPMWADGQAVPDPGVIPLNFVSWSYTLNLADFNSIRDNPNGPIAQTTKEGIAAQLDYYKITVDKLCCGFTGLTGVRDDLGDWFGTCGLLAMESASVSKPGDLGDTDATGGATYDLSAVNLSGGGQTVNGIAKTFGLATARFFNCFSSTDQRAMFKGDGSDTFDFWAHPMVWKTLELAYESNAGGEVDYSMPLLNSVRKYGNIHSTMVADAAYAPTTGATAEVMVTMNTKENFLKLQAIPYTVTGWKPYNDPQRGECFRIMGYEKFGIINMPYLTNQSYYQKAMLALLITPTEDAGE